MLNSYVHANSKSGAGGQPRNRSRSVFNRVVLIVSASLIERDESRRMQIQTQTQTDNESDDTQSRPGRVPMR